jgi:hypothetical protein
VTAKREREDTMTVRGRQSKWDASSADKRDDFTSGQSEDCPFYSLGYLYLRDMVCARWAQGILRMTPYEI